MSSFGSAGEAAALCLWQILTTITQCCFYVLSTILKWDRKEIWHFRNLCSSIRIYFNHFLLGATAHLARQVHFKDVDLSGGFCKFCFSLANP